MERNNCKPKRKIVTTSFLVLLCNFFRRSLTKSPANQWAVISESDQWLSRFPLWGGYTVHVRRSMLTKLSGIKFCLFKGFYVERWFHGCYQELQRSTELCWLLRHLILWLKVLIVLKQQYDTIIQHIWHNRPLELVFKSLSSLYWYKMKPNHLTQFINLFHLELFAVFYSFSSQWSEAKLCVTSDVSRFHKPYLNL